MAAHPIAAGAAVRRYNQIIGFAKAVIAAGNMFLMHQRPGMGEFERDYGVGQAASRCAGRQTGGQGCGRRMRKIRRGTTSR